MATEFVSIDLSDQDPQIPKLGKGKECEKPNCDKKDWTSGYGSRS